MTQETQATFLSCCHSHCYYVILRLHKTPLPSVYFFLWHYGIFTRILNCTDSFHAHELVLLHKRLVGRVLGWDFRVWGMVLPSLSTQAECCLHIPVLSAPSCSLCACMQALVPHQNAWIIDELGFPRPRQHIKKQRHYFASKGPSSQSCGFSSSHVWMWELDRKESWALKNRCFWIAVLEKTLESPLDCKEIQPVHPKGNQSWIFIGRTDIEAETLILWPLDAKSWLIWKDPNAGKDCRREEKGMTEDEMVGWHHRLNGHESE